MTAKTAVRQSTFGVFSGALLVALCLSTAWAMHEQVRCQTCHELSAGARDGVAKDLRVPKNTICFSCHDANQDISGLNPPMPECPALGLRQNPPRMPGVPFLLILATSSTIVIAGTGLFLIFI